MQVHFLLGPAGSGKTFRCLEEIRQALRAAPSGPPLLLIAPKQTTYQLERQLLATPELCGYTRLQILSLDRLARFVFEHNRKVQPRMLDEEGRLMVLRGLLARKRKRLKLFRASSRLAGFARQLSVILGEFQRQCLTPDSLQALSARTTSHESLSLKLQDLSLLLKDYLAWLDDHQLQDADKLVGAATQMLGRAGQESLHLAHVWVDGFAEFSPQELELLVAVLARAGSSTITLCLDHRPTEKISWLSTWSAIEKTFEACRRRFGELPSATISTELLKRDASQSRFQKSPALCHLERHWAESPPTGSNISFPSPSLRVATCADPEAEAVFAARETLAHVRAGGRYREIMVLVRNLGDYHQALQEIFSRYEIPFFLDRRESVSHHPLAELTRSALRTVEFQWKHEDWFAALKSGLVGSQEREIDELENEALARGWKGTFWHQPIRIKDSGYSEAETARLRALETRLESIRAEIVPPFLRFELALAAQRHRPAGLPLASAIRALWNDLGVEARLESWATSGSGSTSPIPASLHATVWDQMHAWLENLELAFTDERLTLREWLPVLESGLANLTVGVIPPALDQVLIGEVHRSRNPEVKLALVLGLNQGILPMTPEPPALLTDSDHAELEKYGVALSPSPRLQLGRERFYAYLAFTRASERLVLTSAQRGAGSTGTRLNPSPFLSQITQLFPGLEVEEIPPAPDWRESQHASELVVPLLKLEQLKAQAPEIPGFLRDFPAVAVVAEQLRSFQQPVRDDSISPDLATRLYGLVLRTSVSRMEQFAACPFRFFVHSGLRAEERKLFELDVREQGTFQHDALAAFHEELRRDKKRWRDISPIEARERIGRIAQVLMASYRDGLLQASEQSRFMARVLSESLQDFVETLVGWMQRQYLFDPVAVELAFGTAGASPAWELRIDEHHRLALRGRIDRIDVHVKAGSDAAHCVVLDYKSSQKKLDPLLVANGLQLQLLAYLNVLRQWPEPKELFGAARLIPAGVFYINLRGRYESVGNRRAAQEAAEKKSTGAYQHSGRFDLGALRLLDARPEVKTGDQFNYRLKNDGALYQNSREALASHDFEALLASVASVLQSMGRQIFSGAAKVDPWREGSDVACDQCDYRAICRIDPWTHKYRTLREISDARANENESG